MNRLEEVMARIGSRPALIRIACAGDYYADSAPYRITNGVAIIDVTGPLSNAAWSWRGTTYGEIQDQVRMAVADPNVAGILLNVNSPGGETDSMFETAQAIAAAGEQKPCWAVANTAAYSAAYLLAAQAEKIYCVPTSGGVGSIGIYCAHFDMSEMLKQQGVKVTLISAGKGKTDGNPYEPLSEAAHANMQADIDRLYGEFVDAVATGRGMKATEVVKLGARCVEGAEAAIAAGLADMSGDLSVALTDLCASIQRASPGNGRFGAAISSAASAASSPKEGSMLDPKAPAEAKVPTAAEIETMVSEARAAGFNDATQIITLCALAGMPAKATEFITARKSAAEVSTALLAAKVEADEKSKLYTGLLPGAAEAKEGAQGKADPWSKVLKAIGIRTKGDK